MLSSQLDFTRRINLKTHFFYDFYEKLKFFILLNLKKLNIMEIKILKSQKSEIFDDCQNLIKWK